MPRQILLVTEAGFIQYDRRKIISKDTIGTTDMRLFIECSALSMDYPNGQTYVSIEFAMLLQFRNAHLELEFCPVPHQK